MKDPFGSMGGFVNQFRVFMQNPIQFLRQRNIIIPPQYANDPNLSIQYLMNIGSMRQNQYNDFRHVSDDIQYNPQFMQMMGGKK